MNRLVIRGLMEETLEEEVCVFKAELQKVDYLWDGHVGLLG